METDRVLAILRSHALDLQADGLSHLRLFGSVARGEAGQDSDVDLLAEFTPGFRVSLLTLSGLRLRVCDLLGVEVDLSSATSLKEPVRCRVQREAIDVF